MLTTLGMSPGASAVYQINSVNHSIAHSDTVYH